VSTELSLDTLADHWQAAWAGKADFAASCAVDVQYEDPVAVVPLEGIAALEAHAERLRTAFPDLRLEATGARLESGGNACFPWRAAATHKGDLPNLPATNRFVVMHGLHYVQLEDGMIRRARGFFDLYDGAVQIGLLPRRGTLGETALLLVRGFGLRSRGSRE
jgi:steroid delta-isomerase-like uncharacterized protein